ncbi:MAG: SPOR domain-containing protein, partial [Sphingomonas sp.]|nr:SPOR domain-containing protein [Sphingomonas sp.]
AQDVPPDQLDSRIQQWMKMATPTRPSDQVAALTGITPAADPGQPVHLALNKAQPPPRMAQTVPVPRPVVAAAPPAAAVQYAEPEPVRYIEPRPRVAPVVAEMPPAPAPQMPTVAEAVRAEPAPEAEPQVAQVLLQPAAQPAASVEPMPTRFEAKSAVADFIPAEVRKPALATGRSGSVVQLGAYGSPRRVAVAWNEFARSYEALNRYTPVSMRFSSPKGIVYRLSVKGFASASEAQQLCGSLQRKGKNCFVRRVAGDAPVQFASR